MQMNDAIARADVLRPNKIPMDFKIAWLHELECDFSETIQAPVFFCKENHILLMPPPYDEAYPLYLAAKIDLANEESALYQDDKAAADTAINRAKAVWRRHHRPKSTGYVRAW